MARFGFLASLLASVAVASPYPPEATAAVTEATKTAPFFFGHKSGNYMPSSLLNATRSIAARVTGEWVNVPALARWDNTNIDDGIGSGSNSYTMYWGAGRQNEGWPVRSQWVSFRNMFDNNKPLMFSSCSQFGQANNAGGEVGAIWDSIQQVAAETGVDHRFILAVVLQESGGCVRAWTSNYGVRNPGIMQCHNGDGTCNSDYTGQVQNPCPTGVITQMIREGTAGTNSGDGLANCINQAGTSADQAFWKAARIYNSGSVHWTSRLECGIATHCYASDIANRLTGWTNAPHNCACDSNFASCNCPN